MWFPRADRPTGHRLFRVCAIASCAGILIGCSFLALCWVAVGFDAEIGRVLRNLGLLLLGTLGLAMLLHYPWSPSWAAANGCKPDDDTTTNG
jgi:hypothetical protein